MIKHLATVITNLLSAIPWIGQDFVEFVKLLLFIITLSIFYYYFTTEHNYNMTTIGKLNESALRGRRRRLVLIKINKLFYLLSLTIL